MPISPRLASAVLITTALSSPTFVYAQTAPAMDQSMAAADDQAPSAQGAADASTPSAAPQNAAVMEETPQVEEQVEVSVPGGEIVVTGRRDRNLEKSSQQVISVLSSAEIARTGEGNIAGALGRVTGLRVLSV